jgi:hypothetical protein
VGIVFAPDRIQGIETAYLVVGGTVASETEDVRQYIEGADYPARAQDLLAAARRSDAPDDVLEHLEQLPTNAQFSDPEEVAEELEKAQGPGEDQAPPGEPAEACGRG